MITIQDRSHASRRYRRARGFSLVEVALALGIFAFSIISMMSLMSVGLNTSRESRERLTRSEILKSVNNEIANTRYDQLATLDGKQIQFDNEGLPVNGSSEHRYVAELTQLPDSEVLQGSVLPGLATFQIEIQDQPGGGNVTSRTEEHVFHIANRGL